jgi:hypothetical protein
MLHNNLFRKLSLTTSIASNSSLRKLHQSVLVIFFQFGYNAVRRTVRAILDGTYEYPPDFDQATQGICEECVRIQSMITKDSLCTNISRENWSDQWRGRQESTSSSESGLHFGH